MHEPFWRIRTDITSVLSLRIFRVRLAPTLHLPAAKSRFFRVKPGFMVWEEIGRTPQKGKIRRRIMITLPRIHRFRFIKHHIRYFQGASVVFRAIESTSVARSFPEEKHSEDNSNNARIFASKETTKILRSILVLKLCSYDFVGRNSMAVRI